MTELYIPKGAMDMASYPRSPIRLGIQGAPGTGKTWAVLTFPNPVYCDLDNKLRGWRAANPDTPLTAVPFWNQEFVVGTMKCNNESNKNNPKFQPNVRDAVDYWLSEEGVKLGPNQTLIFDSWTSLQTFFDLQTSMPHEVEYSAKTGKPDGYAFWRRKMEYSKKIVSALKVLKCNVVVICHETPERDEEGRIVGIKPLQQGQYADEIAGQFTDWYRQRYFDEKTANELKLPKAGYYWQTCKDRYFTMGCKSIPSIADYVPAHYSSLQS